MTDPRCAKTWDDWSGPAWGGEMNDVQALAMGAVCLLVLLLYAWSRPPSRQRRLALLGCAFIMQPYLVIALFTLAETNGRLV